MERHGAPKTLVTDSGSIFLAHRARAVYDKLGVRKEEIEKGRPWQNYSETTFGIQQRVIDRLGYATLMRWRLYAEEGLAGKEAELWLPEKTLTVEHAGEPLSTYEVDRHLAGGSGGSSSLLAVGKPTLFETPFVSECE